MDSLLRAVCLWFVPWQHHLLLAGVQASLDQNTQTVFGSSLILRWHYNTTYHIDPWAGWQPGKPELHDIKPESSDKTFLDKDTFKFIFIIQHKESFEINWAASVRYFIQYKFLTCRVIENSY